MTTISVPTKELEPFEVKDFQSLFNTDDGIKWEFNFSSTIESCFIYNEQEGNVTPTTVAAFVKRFRIFFADMQNVRSLIIIDRRGAILEVLNEVTFCIDNANFYELISDYETGKRWQRDLDQFEVFKLKRCLECMDTIVLNLDYFVSLI